MQLRFINGSAQTPRGHAIIIARGATKSLATYCIVLPIQFSLSRYIPPIMASSLPTEALQGMNDTPSVMPVPPMLEDIPSVDALIALGQMRDDDIIEVDGIDTNSDMMRRMEMGSELCNNYGQLYATYIEKQPLTQRATLDEPARHTAETSIADSSVESLLNDAPTLSDREQLADVARLIGTLRYAQDGQDNRLLEETKRSLRRATAPLSEKYRADELINAALLSGPVGQKLADLYLTRAYKLVDEDYPAIPAIEEQIRQLSETGH